MTNKEAMQMALDALELLDGAETVDGVIVYTDQEIKALRAALAQPEKEWVGLTDEEIREGNKESWVTTQAWQSACWWAEAKLKEKNG